MLPPLWLHHGYIVVAPHPTPPHPTVLTKTLLPHPSPSTLPHHVNTTPHPATPCHQDAANHAMPCHTQHSVHCSTQCIALHLVPKHLTESPAPVVRHEGAALMAQCADHARHIPCQQVQVVAVHPLCSARGGRPATHEVSRTSRKRKEKTARAISLHCKHTVQEKQDPTAASAVPRAPRMPFLCVGPRVQVAWVGAASHTPCLVPHALLDGMSSQPTRACLDPARTVERAIGAGGTTWRPKQRTCGLSLCPYPRMSIATLRACGRQADC